MENVKITIQQPKRKKTDDYQENYNTYSIDESKDDVGTGIRLLIAGGIEKGIYNKVKEKKKKKLIDKKYP